MTLYIDTTDFNKVMFALSDKRIIRQTYKIYPHKSHETLAKLDEFLKKSSIRNPQSVISQIITNKGPGSYTGVRVGVTHAQALGFAWNVPVKFVSKDKFVVR